MSIDVKWRAAIVDDIDPFTNEITSIIGDPWAEQQAYAPRVVEDIAEDYFSERGIWEDLFGYDWSGAIEIRVSEPPHMAGTWRVRLELKIDATATRELGQ